MLQAKALLDVMASVLKETALFCEGELCLCKLEGNLKGCVHICSSW